MAGCSFAPLPCLCWELWKGPHRKLAGACLEFGGTVPSRGKSDIFTLGRRMPIPHQCRSRAQCKGGGSPLSQRPLHYVRTRHRCACAHQAAYVFPRCFESWVSGRRDCLHPPVGFICSFFFKHKNRAVLNPQQLSGAMAEYSQLADYFIRALSEI